MGQVPGAGLIILHQPLNLSNFCVFCKKAQNMNGVSVCLGPKTQNAPTWQVEKQAGRSVFSAIFRSRNNTNFPGSLRKQHFTIANSLSNL